MNAMRKRLLVGGLLICFVAAVYWSNPDSDSACIVVDADWSISNYPSAEFPYVDIVGFHTDEDGITRSRFVCEAIMTGSEPLNPPVSGRKRFTLKVPSDQVPHLIELDQQKCIGLTVRQPDESDINRKRANWIERQKAYFLFTLRKAMK